MKIKLMIDFSNEEAKEVVDYLFEYRKTNDFELEILGYDLTENDYFNNAYYGLYYANKYGVGLEYAKQVLNDHHTDNKDISRLDKVSESYQAIGHNKNDIIDAIIDGDYEEMHDYFQHRIKNEKIDEGCYAYIYDNEEKKLLVGAKEIIAYLK